MVRSFVRRYSLFFAVALLSLTRPAPTLACSIAEPYTGPTVHLPLKPEDTAKLVRFLRLGGNWCRDDGTVLLLSEETQTILRGLADNISLADLERYFSIPMPNPYQQRYPTAIVRAREDLCWLFWANEHPPLLNVSRSEQCRKAARKRQ